MIPKFKREGFWWARWIKADPGTADDGEAADGMRWEVVEVFANVSCPDTSDDWRVAVTGVEKSQSVQNFEWGYRIEHREAQALREIAETERKAATATIEILQDAMN